MGTKPPIDTLNTLHKCAEIEGVLGKIYDLFADAYRENRDISRLFEKTAGEERNHEYQIRLAIKSFAPAIESMNLTVEEADKHLTMVQETLDWLAKTTPGIEEALDLSISLESRFSRFHMDTAARFAEQSCGKLFTAMMAADEAHVVSMEKALAELRSTGAALGACR